MDQQDRFEKGEQDRRRSPVLAREEQLRDRACQLNPPMPPADAFALCALDVREVIRLLDEFGGPVNRLVDAKARELDAERGTLDGDAPTAPACHDARLWLAWLRPDIADAEARLRYQAEHLWRRTRSRELLQAACAQHQSWASWELAVEQAVRRHERRDHSHTATAVAPRTALPRVRARSRERRARRARSSASSSSRDDPGGDSSEGGGEPPGVGALTAARRRAAA